MIGKNIRGVWDLDRNSSGDFRRFLGVPDDVNVERLKRLRLLPHLEGLEPCVDPLAIFREGRPSR